MGILRLNGRAEMKVRPEITVVTMTVNGMTDDYQESLRILTEHSAELKDTIASNGIEKEDIKTLDFWVKAENERWWDEKEKRYHTDFLGYGYHQTLKFRFPNDNCMLSRIVYEAGRLESVPEIGITFITDRTKEFEATLLKEAMADAMMKANALKDSGGFDIISVKEVRAECDDPHMDDICCNCCDDELTDIDLEPEEYVLSARADVTLEIG